MEYRCENICKIYGSQEVLEDISFSFHEGERVCLIAPSGGGKTTLLRILAGLELPDSGKVYGFDQAKIGMVFQEDRLCGERSALTNVAMVLEHPKEAGIMAALKEVLPVSCLSKPVKELSGGMRRRVAIVRAMLSEGTVLLLDEPFSGLDEESRKQTIDFIRSRQAGRLLIFTAHSQKESHYLDAIPIAFQSVIC